MNATVLVSGGSGFVGGHVVLQLSVCPGRLSTVSGPGVRGSRHQASGSAHSVLFLPRLRVTDYLESPISPNYIYPYEYPAFNLAAFPESARRDAGYELFMIQVGRTPTDFKPLPRVGPGAHELRVRDEAGAFRVIYVAKFEEAVYVLQAFQKKTRKTRQADIDLAAARYRMIGEQR